MLEWVWPGWSKPVQVMDGFALVRQGRKCFTGGKQGFPARSLLAKSCPQLGQGSQLYLLFSPFILVGVFRAVKGLGGFDGRNGCAAGAITSNAAHCAAFRTRSADLLPAMAVILALPIRQSNDHQRKMQHRGFLRMFDENLFIPKVVHG